ncbi:MAG: hypothetical protein ACRDFB_06485 [Rhabdochlamydiaceae bacterium]
MRTRHNISSKQTGVLLGVLALVAILAIPQVAFAQQVSKGPSSFGVGQKAGIPLGPPYGTAQPMHQGTFYALIVGMAAIIAIGAGTVLSVKHLKNTAYIPK